MSAGRTDQISGEIMDTRFGLMVVVVVCLLVGCVDGPDYNGDDDDTYDDVTDDDDMTPDDDDTTDDDDVTDDDDDITADDDDTTEECTDIDGDGWTTCDGDCDDNDPAMNLDDADEDGFTACDGDCNDFEAGEKPGYMETMCDGLDNDCNQNTPDGPDFDNDGWNACVDCDDHNAGLNLNDAENDGWSTCDGDCDDFNHNVHPGATEVCDDGVDNDCNGVIDCR